MLGGFKTRSRKEQRLLNKLNAEKRRARKGQYYNLSEITNSMDYAITRGLNEYDPYKRAIGSFGSNQR
jgi:hypothetical protein